MSEEGNNETHNGDESRRRKRRNPAERPDPGAKHKVQIYLTHPLTAAYQRLALNADLLMQEMGTAHLRHRITIGQYVSGSGQVGAQAEAHLNHVKDRTREIRRRLKLRGEREFPKRLRTYEQELSVKRNDPGVRPKAQLFISHPVTATYYHVCVAIDACMQDLERGHQNNDISLKDYSKATHELTELQETQQNELRDLWRDLRKRFPINPFLRRGTVKDGKRMDVQDGKLAEKPSNAQRAPADKSETPESAEQEPASNKKKAAAKKKPAAKKKTAAKAGTEQAKDKGSTAEKSAAKKKSASKKKSSAVSEPATETRDTDSDSEALADAVQGD